MRTSTSGELQILGMQLLSELLDIPKIRLSALGRWTVRGQFVLMTSRMTCEHGDLGGAERLEHSSIDDRPRSQFEV